MSSPKSDFLVEITPEILLNAYRCGVFPMAKSKNAKELYWIDPPHRGIIPLNKAHISRSLRKTIRSEQFEVRVDSNFDLVVKSCAEKTAKRDTTWINRQIVRLYSELFDMGFCHTIETWKNGKLVGGLYGVALNGAFFGESMFCRVTNSSKVALIYLIARLIHGKYRLLDTQFYSPHLMTFGAIEIMRTKFFEKLTQSMETSGDFSKLSEFTTGNKILQIIDEHSKAR